MSPFSHVGLDLSLVMGLNLTGEDNDFSCSLSVIQSLFHAKAFSSLTLSFIRDACNDKELSDHPGAEGSN